MASDPGSYALLLGSGLSRAAGIPTGWEILVDLISKVAAADGVAAADDLPAWYRARFGEEPGYASLLEALSPRPAERTALLRSYFEASDEDREQGLRTPTAAHRAIARLVATGTVRLILTTNFDRLIEEALAEVGVNPVVVASDAAAESAPPPDRSRCTVVKLHGDYLDTRLRNTPAELASYEPRMTVLLERCLDDYGLVVAGWSAQWDTGLRELVRSRAGRRYSTYWVRRGALTEEAAEVVSSIQAGVIATPGADVFFGRLHEQVLAVEALAGGQPISDRVAVATVKRLIPQPDEFIRLEDYFSELQTRALNATRGLEDPPGGPGDGDYISRLAQFEAAAMPVAGSAAAICAWGDQGDLVPRAIRRLTRVPPTGGYTYWLALRKYLASLVFYAAGCAAVHRQRYSELEQLFSIRLEVEGQERIASDALAATNVLVGETVGREEVRVEGKDPDQERRRTPVSDRYLRVLRPALHDVVIDDEEFTSSFEMLELLLSIHVSVRNGSCAPGRFAWRSRVAQRLQDQVDRVGETWGGVNLYGGLDEFNRGFKITLEQTRRIAFP
jgi:SIR2-like domain